MEMEHVETLKVCAHVGALTGLGLSFTSLSPLVIGGIIGSMVPAFFTALYVEDLVYKFYKKDRIDRSGKDTLTCGIITLASIAIGVGLASSVTTVFPGAMIGKVSAALVGIAVGVIAPVAALCAVVAAVFAVQKVNEYIISPVVERFSSKGGESKLPQHVSA